MIHAPSAGAYTSKIIEHYEHHVVAAWKGDTFKQVIKRYRTALSGRRHDCRTREVRWRPAQGGCQSRVFARPTVS
jgi:hypothetical protein